MTHDEQTNGDKVEVTDEEVEKLEEEARSFLATQFVRTVDVQHEKEGVAAGKYIYLQFDTIRNPAGEGEFKVVCVKAADGWSVADYESLPASGHRR